MATRTDRRGKLDAMGARTSALHAVDLRAEHQIHPLGMDNVKPRLSWRLDSSERNIKQFAYRIIASTSHQALRAERADLWDTGRVESAHSFDISYCGKQLNSRQLCWWSVQVWDDRGSPPTFSEASSFEMGLLNPNDWTAQWLAVEDALTKGDRETGLNWIWGQQPAGSVSRKFRFSFELPARALASVLTVVVNDCHFFMQITRVWLNGEIIAGPGVWITVSERPSLPDHLY